MNISVNDYIVINGENPLLGKVTKTNPLQARLQPDDENIQHTVDVSLEDVLAVLGEKPVEGYVYGIDTTNIYKASREIPPFGTLNYYISVPKETRKSLQLAFSSVSKKLDRLSFPLYDDDFIFNCKKLSGKVAGMYLPSELPVVTIDPTKAEPKDYPFIISHELGHHVLSNYVSLKGVSHWIKIYSQYIESLDIENKSIRSIKESFEDSKNTPKEYRQDLTDDDRLVFDSCIKAACKQLKITSKEAENLSDMSPLYDAFPVTLRKLTYEPVISLYATKNYKEFFCEAFAMFVTNRPLPDNIRKAMDRTIKIAKTRRDKL